MLSLEIIIAVVFIGVLHLGIGLLLGRQLQRGDETSRHFNGLWRPPDVVAESKDRPALTLPSDVADLLNRLVDQVARLSNTVQAIKPSPTIPQAEEVGPDAAGITDATWFPIEASSNPVELRRSRRFPYEHVQEIAPVIDDVLPDDSSFVEVLFRDISKEGFSFYTDNEFMSEQLVAELGTPPDIVPVLARVVHQKEVWHKGTWVFQVGCMILRRLDSAPTPQEEPTTTPCVA